jgi:uncharacterized protein (UPF0332 family)
MEKIKWCFLQKKGIKIIELKPHLSQSYMKEADETLENVFTTKGKWKVITAYYACYNAIYSILMKCGIKCEIHDCSIALMKFFEFEKSNIGFMNDLKDKRIQAQYYLKKLKLKDEKPIKEFVLKCKIILRELNSDKIGEIRSEIRKLSKK